MSDNKHKLDEKKQGIAKVNLLKLVLIPVIMFGFGFALIPLYSVFCDVTGLNGKTGQVEAAVVSKKDIDLTRTIKVKFLANTGTGLPWKFKPLQTEMEVHPGQIYKAMYQASSSADHATVGQAVPSVAPTEASLHFNKTECFCFSKQEMAAHESRDMPLRFVINHEIPDNIHEVTLSYTFFNIEQKG